MAPACSDLTRTPIAWVTSEFTWSPTSRADDGPTQRRGSTCHNAGNAVFRLSLSDRYLFGLLRQWTLHKVVTNRYVSISTRTPSLHTTVLLYNAVKESYSTKNHLPKQQCRTFSQRAWRSRMAQHHFNQRLGATCTPSMQSS